MAIMSMAFMPQLGCIGSVVNRKYRDARIGNIAYCILRVEHNRFSSAVMSSESLVKWFRSNFHLPKCHLTDYSIQV